MKVLIVEDEPLAVKKLERLLTDVAIDIEIIGSTGSIRDTVDWLAKYPAPDLIFMDIELSDGQSFSIFERTRVNCPVIFTTSYDEYALQAFKVNSVDYLLKPVQKDELSNALEKYREIKTMYAASALPISSNIENLLISLAQKESGKEYRNRFLVKHLNKLVSVDIADIAYFWSEGRVNFFKSKTGQKYIVDYTMDEIETMIDPKNWFRVSRQFIVSIPSVSEIHPYFNNRLKLFLTPKEPEEVTVSRERVADFKVWLGK